MNFRTTVTRGARLALISALALVAAGCAEQLDRLSQIGKSPKMTPIENPTAQKGYAPITMPMPAPVALQGHPNSLWRPGGRDFLKDQRTNNVGDIVTVTIKIEDKASVNNSSTRTRATTENDSASALLGYQQSLGRILPQAIDPTNLLDIEGTTNNKGTGAIERNETINLKVAAVITQRLPNGNLVIQGRQEVRVNYETRDLIVSGIIRPEDITTNNTISHEQIAEARIAYGDRGQMTDMQQPRFGTQILDIIYPF
ncbi:MAG: flagellar basal body L-ring protein FlgH [Alphaproteobacteria bacterium]|nr:flagellar basal body L-ring protein FlgH [Alphaproteobacteria bacterium]